MIELRYLRSGKDQVRVLVPVACVLAGQLLAGCSTGITRFDSPSFALNDTATTGSVDRSSGYGEGALSQQSPSTDYGRSHGGPVTGSSVSASSLPDVSPETGSYSERNYAERSTSRSNTSYQADSSYDSTYDRAPERAAPEQRYAESRPQGDSIVVQPGDTLYSLSRRHGVQVSEMMSVNGLTSSNLRVGQRLTVPGGASASVASGRSYEAPRHTAAASSYETPAATRTAYTEADAPQTASAHDWNGTHTVAPGESIYGIARQHGVTAAELQRHNGLSDPQRVMPGAVLRVPGSSSGSAVADSQQHRSGQKVAALQNYSQSDASPAPAYTPPAEPAAYTPPSAPAASSQAAPSYAPQASEPAASATQTRGVRTVSISPPASDATSPAASAPVTAAGKLRWPARGRVISNFGPRPDGTHNDGVNLSVPMGAEVHAAEDGVVAYAGSELRGYGNLILLRHSNGWVTAYAHNESISVKRGDKVSRGQVIAKAGKTGEVDQPQLHFELRMGSKPVDPLPYLETL